MFVLLSYGFLSLLIFFCNFLLLAFIMHFKIFCELKSQFITFFGIYFPFCLVPKLITGFLKEAASTIPLDEFPSKIEAFLKR